MALGDDGNPPSHRRAARIRVGGHAGRCEAPHARGLLLPEHGRERAELLPQLAFSETGDLTALQDVVDETTTTAKASGDPSLEAYASILRLWIRHSWNPEGWAEAAETEATKALSAFGRRDGAQAWLRHPHCDRRAVLALDARGHPRRGRLRKGPRRRG